MTTFTRRHDGDTYDVEVGTIVYLHGGGFHQSSPWVEGTVEKIGRTRIHISCPKFYSSKPVPFAMDAQAEVTDRPGGWYFRTAQQRVDEERRLEAIAKLRTVGLTLSSGRCPTDLLVGMAELIPDPEQ